MKARLFVALELPDAVREALVAWRAPLLRDADELRAVAPEALHVTLAFLGWQPEEAIAPLGELVDACAATTGSARGARGGASGLALGKPLWLPRRRPRVLAIALEDRHGQLAALQAELVERLAGDGRYEPEARPYLPHVTVARVRGRAPARTRELPTTAFGGDGATEVVFDGTAVVLYRSHLSSAGTRYEPLSVNKLA